MFIFDLCQYFDSYLNYLIVLLDYHFYHRIDHYIYHLLCLAYRSSIDFTMLIKNWLIALIFWYFIDFTVKVVFYYLNQFKSSCISFTSLVCEYNYLFSHFKNSFNISIYDIIHNIIGSFCIRNFFNSIESTF